MKSKLRNQYYEAIRPNYAGIVYNKFQHPILRKYCLFPNDNAVTQSLIKGFLYEPYMFDFLKDNSINLIGTDVIEIGSNNGHFTIEFAELVGNKGRVFAFEPQRIIYQQLCCNVFLNGLDNVFAYQVAIGNEIGKVKFEYLDYFSSGEVNFGDVSVYNEKKFNNKLHEEVIAQKLDSYEFQEVKVIKIDVQGYEYNVIEGALKTIEKYKPYIFIEIEEKCLIEFGSSEKELIQKIESLGYVVKRFQEGIPYNSSSGYCLDCVCIPKEKYDLKQYIIK
jgi:FkbM family methyltransferase